MTNGPLSGVLRQLACAAIEHEGLTDGQLLAAFIARRDEAAFAALVRRHAPMVWGVSVAIRRGTPHGLEGESDDQ